MIYVYMYRTVKNADETKNRYLQAFLRSIWLFVRTFAVETTAFEI